jgi:hypothetical protein
MHDLLMDHQDALTARYLVGYAGDLGLGTERFRAELFKHSGAPRVAEDVDQPTWPLSPARRRYSSTATATTARSAWPG